MQEEENEPPAKQVSCLTPHDVIRSLDMRQILEIKAPNIDQNMIQLISSMINNTNVTTHGRRWDRSVIQFALQFWCRSPQAYIDVSSTGYMILPSVSLLQHYKNIIEQGPGFNTQVLKWMLDTARSKNLPKHAYNGGLLFDEMSIQPDLQMDNKGSCYKLVGSADYGHDGNHIEVIRKGQKSLSLASHVLQLEFLGHTGFKFPLAHFPTVQAEAYHLYTIFWDAIRHLNKLEFNVTFCLFDGASANRKFLKMLFDGKDPEDNKMVIANIFNPESNGIVVSTEPKHIIKRLRNNILVSGDDSNCTRKLSWRGHFINWNHWKEAYQWDKTMNKEMTRVHHKLTDEHMNVSDAGKMRNHLAEECLGKEMLHLMVVYQRQLLNGGRHLTGSIELLRHTSTMVSIFNDDRPVTDMSDTRLCDIVDVKAWFKEWEREVKAMSTLKASDRNRHMMSAETMEDVRFCITGFISITEARIAEGFSVMPSRINSDVVENFFCQQRSRNGDNTNPTYLQYCKNVNTISLGQTSKGRARKSNVGLKGAEPFNFHPPTTKTGLRL